MHVLYDYVCQNVQNTTKQKKNRKFWFLNIIKCTAYASKWNNTAAVNKLYNFTESCCISAIIDLKFTNFYYFWVGQQNEFANVLFPEYRRLLILTTNKIEKIPFFLNKTELFWTSLQWVINQLSLNLARTECSCFIRAWCTICKGNCIFCSDHWTINWYFHVQIITNTLKSARLLKLKENNDYSDEPKYFSLCSF